MPIYEYICASCSHTAEVMQKISDPAPETCTACGATKTLSKMVSRSSFQLKGGGWYADLYSSTKKSGGESGGGGSSSAA